MQPNERGVLRISRRTALIIASIVVLAGGFLAWSYLKPEPSPRTVVMRYLKHKSKPMAWKETVDPSLRDAPTPWLDVQKVLDADEAYSAMYRHLAEYVVYADLLLRAKDPAEQTKGLQLVLACVRGASTGPQDDWLAARMCEAFLLSSIKLVQGKPGAVANRDQLIQHTIQAIQRSEDTDGQVVAYRKIAARETAPHEGDWARSQAVALLTRYGKDKEAAVLLAEIKDPRMKTWWGRRLASFQKTAAPKPVTPKPAAPTNVPKK